jgi:hypothetical protein
MARRYAIAPYITSLISNIIVQPPPHDGHYPLDLPCPYRFSHGKRKALVMSYDDGSEHDRRLVDIFNRYGIRGSFHLNSGRLGLPHHISPGELPSLYQGHEISCHTANHPDLTQLPEEAIRREILDDRHALEDWSGRPVRGLAYPFGTYDDRILALLPKVGIDYARTVICTETFQISPDFLRWQTTCHHNRAMDLAERFLQDDGAEPALLYIWGHSYELDGFMSGDLSKNWDYMEALCRHLHGHEAVHYTTTIELVDYLNAVRRLAWSATTVTNNAPMTVWLHWQGNTVELQPGASMRL